MPADQYPPLAKHSLTGDMIQRRPLEAILEGLPSSLIARVLACKGTINRTRELRQYDLLDGPTAITLAKLIGKIEQCCASRKIAEVLMHYDGSEDKHDPEDHPVLEETRWE